MTAQEPILHALLANVDEGVHVVDRTGATVLYNPQAGLNDGLAPDEVIGKHVLEVFPSLNEHTSTLLKVLMTGQPALRQQQTFMNYKGKRVTTINSTWPIYRDGQLIGAIEISKDVTQVKELSEQVVSLQAELLGKRQHRVSRSTADARYTLDDLMGCHPRLVSVKEQALRAARGGSPILVYGETGTGKELLVHAIHRASLRSAGPFIAQNCAALPEGLLEGILFGTVKGSFTGAEDRPGLFELADSGTLYLDEINAMDPNLQAKLLRVLQDGWVRRVGDIHERKVDVRVIVSTNEDPTEAVAQRHLRRDLYYRVNVVNLELPPLRDRREDIPLLTNHFLHKHRGVVAPEVATISPAVLQFFQRYDWPGNVRELEHAVEAALHMANSETLQIENLPNHLQRAAHELGISSTTGRSHPGVNEPGPQWEQEVMPLEHPGEFRELLAANERAAVQSALERSDWNLSKAARLLGIPRQTLQYRVRVLGICRPQAKGAIG